MPKPPSSSAPPVLETPVEKLARFNRLDLYKDPSGSGWYSECLWCGSEKNLRFKDNTQCHCWSCDERGNDTKLTQLIYETSSIDHEMCVQLAADSGAEDTEGVAITMAEWAGLKKHGLSGEPCLPGYNAEGAVGGLYIWRKLKNSEGQWKPRLQASPNLGNHLLGLGYELEHHGGLPESVMITEGWRDGTFLRWALDEYTDGTLFDDPVAVLAITGVTGFKASWVKMLEDHGVQDVFLLLDNDHPRTNRLDPTGPKLPGAGPSGMKRLAGMFVNDSTITPHYLDWSGVEDPAIYNAAIESKSDIRDLLTGNCTLA